MLPIIIHTRRFPPKRFHAITLFPFVFHNGEPLTESEIRHETIHMWQQLAFIFVGFYLIYLVAWLVNLIRYRDSFKAYLNIPFERYAYANEENTGLTRSLMAFGWLGKPKNKQ